MWVSNVAEHRNCLSKIKPKKNKKSQQTAGHIAQTFLQRLVLPSLSTTGKFAKKY